MSQHSRILLALALGTLAGVLLHPFAGNEDLLWANRNLLQPVGQIFLRMIFMAVVPLLFSALALGVYELRGEQGFGAIASRTLGFTVLASAASVIIGVALVNVLQPGAGFQIDTARITEASSAIGTIQKNADATKEIGETIAELFPKNPLAVAVNALGGDILPFMVFALIFGLALAQSDDGSDDHRTFVRVLDRLMKVSMNIVAMAIRLAPFGVFAIIFNTVFTFGAEVLASLLFYVGVVVAGLLAQQLIVYPILLRTFTSWSPMDFFRRCREVYLYAFSTASSNATLPISLETAEKRLGLPPEISRFVLTVGSTANQNGTALFEGVTVLFLAQVYGVELDLSQQLRVVFMSIVAGIGTAGVPGGSLPMVMLLLVSVGIPPEGIGLILGVDRFLDMCRTTLNVSGDLVMAALVTGRTHKPDVAQP
jgi:DAACS family dicarboxylate/amino acid:cation (Na+ or H+) symporter